MPDRHTLDPEMRADSAGEIGRPALELAGDRVRRVLRNVERNANLAGRDEIGDPRVYILWHFKIAPDRRVGKGAVTGGISRASRWSAVPTRPAYRFHRVGTAHATP